MKIRPSKLGKLLMPIFALFNVVNIGFLIGADKFDTLKIDHNVVIFGNALLFLLATISLGLHIKAGKKENPNVLVRSVMISTFIKMIVIAVTVLVYVKLMKEEKSTYAVLVTMFLYLIYMFMEVKIALRLNKKSAANASN
jgi:high-affinity K+ transport system ATPase subunit B